MSAIARTGRKRNRLKKLFVSILATTIGFFCCEFAARLLIPAPQGVREPQIRCALSPDLGYCPVPNQRGWTLDAPATINAFGFRGREPTLPKPPGKFRIMIPGSSNSFGWGVGDDDTFSEGLERLLSQGFPQRSYEVLNWSVPGYNLDQDERLLRFCGAALDPDLVLLEFTPFDLWYRDVTPNDAAGSLPAASPGPADRADGFPMPILAGSRTYTFQTTPSWCDRVVSSSRALHCAKLGAGQVKSYLLEGKPGGVAVLEGEDQPAITEGWARVTESLRSIKGWIAEHHCAAAVIVFPRRGQVEGDYSNAKYQTRLRPIAEELGFYVIDPLPKFREHRHRSNELFLPYDGGHPGALGHRLIAEAIFEFLRDHPHLRRPVSDKPSHQKDTEP